METAIRFTRGKFVPGREEQALDLFAEVTTYFGKELADGNPTSRRVGGSERRGGRSPQLVDDKDSSVGRAFGLHGTPFWVFLDERGRVAGRLEAELGGAGLERALEMLEAQASTEPAG